MKPFTVRCNLHGDLDFFLRSGTDGRSIERNLSEKTSVKDVIESCGVPHPEIDLILVNGAPVDFYYGITSDADIELYPAETKSPQFKEKRLQVATITTFVADGHLGKLARNLRLLGFDVAYDPQAEDRQLLRRNGTRKSGAPDTRSSLAHARGSKNRLLPAFTKR